MRICVKSRHRNLCVKSSAGIGISAAARRNLGRASTWCTK